MSVIREADFSDFSEVDIGLWKLLPGDGRAGLEGILTNASESRGSFSVEILREQEDSCNQFSIKVSSSGPILVPVCRGRLCSGCFGWVFDSPPSFT